MCLKNSFKWTVLIFLVLNLQNSSASGNGNSKAKDFLSSIAIGHGPSPWDFLDRLRDSTVLMTYARLSVLKSRLSYGEKCNVDLEEKYKELENTAYWPFFEKNLPLLKWSLGFDPYPKFEFIENLMNAMMETEAPMRELIRTVRKSDIRGFCSADKFLHCDPEIGECRCGISNDPVLGQIMIAENVTMSNVSFSEDGKKIVSVKKYYEMQCQYDVGSGCFPQDLEQLVSPALFCRSGTECVTAILKAPCEEENVHLEETKFPYRFQNNVEKKGYVCFCQDKTSNSSTPTVTTIAPSPRTEE